MYIGKHVKLLLQNNLVLEGTIEEWSNKKVSILSVDKKSTSVILHPKYDIRVVKIIHEENESEKESEKEKVLQSFPVKPIVQAELQEKFKQVQQSPSNDELRLKTLTELKEELNKQEKIMIASKLKEHKVGEVKTIKYEQPRFFTKQSSK